MKYSYFISYCYTTKEKTWFSAVGRILDHKVESEEDVRNLIWQISKENGIDRSKENLIILGITLLKEINENE